MFKKSISLQCENVIKAANLKDKPKKLLDFYTPNDEILSKIRVTYELRGEYLPRRKINPFKKRPMTVIYDQGSFRQFVLPSQRDHVHSAWSHEELFGVKRWANHSAFIKEYIRVDNQIFAILFFSLFLLWPYYFYKHRRFCSHLDDTLTAEMGNYSVEDLV